MKILALDTSTTVGSVAITEDDNLLYEIKMNNGMTHSENVMPMIDEALNRLGLKISDIDVFAVAEGPGSFTGLRIGVATVKGLASIKGNSARCIANINTLVGLRNNISLKNGIVCTVLNARNDQVFAAAYDLSSGKCVLECRAESVFDFIEQVYSSCEGRIILCGDAAQMHFDKFVEKFGQDGVLLSRKAECINSAYSLALEAYHMYNENRLISALELSPNYYRKSQAQQLKEKKG